MAGHSSVPRFLRAKDSQQISTSLEAIVYVLLVVAVVVIVVGGWTSGGEHDPPRCAGQLQYVQTGTIPIDRIGIATGIHLDVVRHVTGRGRVLIRFGNI